jgi:hypothetical protein
MLDYDTFGFVLDKNITYHYLLNHVGYYRLVVEPATVGELDIALHSKHQMSQIMILLQPDRDSNPGWLTYREKCACSRVGLET